MSELENNLIKKVKILILYGNRPVDGENKDGKVERIFRDEDDTAHYFYIREFLQSHMKDEKEVQEIIEKKNDYTVPIVVSGLGIALAIIYLIGKNTARVYVKTDKGFKLIRVVKLSKKHNTVNLSEYKHKTVTNIFAIKTTNRFYNKNKNMLIKVKKEKITKNVYLNNAYIDFILG